MCMFYSCITLVFLHMYYTCNTCVYCNITKTMSVQSVYGEHVCCFYVGISDEYGGQVRLKLGVFQNIPREFRLYKFNIVMSTVFVKHTAEYFYKAYYKRRSLIYN